MLRSWSPNGDLRCAKLFCISKHASHYELIVIDMRIIIYNNNNDNYYDQQKEVNGECDLVAIHRRCKTIRMSFLDMNHNVH
jgi:hypothetical protein